MARYSYNSTVLPKIPEVAGHALIVNDGKYVVFFSSSPLYVKDGSIVNEYPGPLATAYVLNDMGMAWVEVDVSIDADENTQYAIYPGSFVWTSDNIVDIDTNKVVHYGTLAEYHSPDIPIVELYCDGSTTVPLEEPGWHVQARLRLEVSDMDGSSRSVKWYVNGSEWKEGGYSQKPVCDAEGTYTYHVVVTETGFNGGTSSGTSNTVVITVKDYNLGDWNSGGSTDDNIPWDDIVSPYPDDDLEWEDDPEERAQAPTVELRIGATLFELGEEADSIACIASAEGGGELSYSWYENGNLISSESDIIPATDEYGKKTYFCVVTNTLNGTRESTMSEKVVITTWSHNRFQNGIVVGLACKGWHHGETMNPVYDPFRQGIEIGRMLKAQRIDTGHFLYDGVMLPEVPDWDMEKYPYAYIRCYNGRYFFGVVSSKPYHTVSGTSETVYYSGWYRNYKLEDGNWVLYSEGFGVTGFGIDSSSGWGCVWSNWDILYLDGSVYHAAGSSTDQKIPSAPPDPLPVPQDRAASYLYGDVEMPALPEWDMSVYPYAYVADNRLLVITRFPNISEYVAQSNALYGMTNTALNDNSGWRGFSPFNGATAASYNKEYLRSVVWSNHDIANTSGDVVFEANTPQIAPVEDVGIFVYNGYRLPGLPDWDRDKYPYAYIISYPAGAVKYHLWVTDTPIYIVYHTDDDDKGVYTDSSINFLIYVPKADMSSWFLHSHDSMKFQHTYTPIWALVSMKKAWYKYVSGSGGSYTKTDEIGLEETDPISADECPPPNQNTFWYGCVELPDISTVWTDRDNYRYAAIVSYRDSWCLKLFGKDSYYWEGKYSYIYFGSHKDYGGAAGSIRYLFDKETCSWVFDSQNDYDQLSVNSGAPAWSSFDLEYDGGMYFKSHAPVPVK